MKLSIIIPVLNSHEVLRRQLIHFSKMDLSDTEIIIVDDGSDPPLEAPNIRIHRTNDFRPWTWALARNAGAKIAKGEYLLMFDVDHIVLQDLIDSVKSFNGHKMQFKREFGILDEHGVFTQNIKTLRRYGLSRKGVKVPPLPNNFAMRKDIFWELGGYREDLVERPYPQGEDRLFKGAWQGLVNKGKYKVCTYRPTIYMFPNGQFCGDIDYNPFGLFHNLSRKTNRNHLWRKSVKT